MIWVIIQAATVLSWSQDVLPLLGYDRQEKGRTKPTNGRTSRIQVTIGLPFVWHSGLNVESLGSLPIDCTGFKAHRPSHSRLELTPLELRFVRLPSRFH